MKTLTRTTLSVALLLAVTSPQGQTTQPSAAAGTVNLSRSLDTKTTLQGSGRQFDVSELRLPASAIIGTTTVYAESQYQIDMVESAIDRFEAAGP